MLTYQDIPGSTKGHIAQSNKWYKWERKKINYFEVEGAGKASWRQKDLSIDLESYIKVEGSERMKTVIQDMEIA